jgi:hypothetical protein
MSTYSTRAFISYSSEDRETAGSLWLALHRAGLRPWISQSNIPGGVQSWASEVDKAIELSDYVLLLLSEHSARSRHVAREMGLADTYRKPIVVIQAAPISREFDQHARTIHYYTINAQRLHLTERDIAGCVAEIKHLIRTGAPKSRRLSAVQPPFRVQRRAILAQLDREWRPLLSEVEPPRLLAFVGLSGCGKTTLADDFLDALPCPDQRVRSSRELSIVSPLPGSIVFLDEFDTDNLDEIAALLRGKLGNCHLIVSASREEHVLKLKRCLPEHLGPSFFDVPGLPLDEFLNACFGHFTVDQNTAAGKAADKLHHTCGGLPLCARLFRELNDQETPVDDLALFFDELSSEEIVACLFGRLLKEFSRTNPLAERVLVILSEMVTIGMNIDAISYVLGVPERKNEIAKAIAPLMARGLIERVQLPDGAVRCHNLLKSVAADRCTVDELKGYRRRYLAYLENLLQYSSDRIDSHRSSITFWDAIMSKVFLEFWQPGIFEGQVENNLSSFLINLDLFSISENGRLRQGVVRCEKAAVKDWIVLNAGTYIHQLNCAHGIALAQLARKFSVPDPQLGDTFLVGWNAGNSVGHGFSRNVELRDPGAAGASAIDAWVRAECILTSAYHWAGLPQADRKIRADVIERNLRGHFSLPSDSFSRLTACAYGVALTRLGDPRLAHHTISGQCRSDPRYALFSIVLFLRAQREHKIIEDIVAYYGYKFHNMPPVLQAFLHCIGVGSLPYGVQDIEYNAKLKYVLGSWAESEEFQEFIQDLVARSQSLETDFTRCKVSLSVLHDIVSTWRRRLPSNGGDRRAALQRRTPR